MDSAVLLLHVSTVHHVRVGVNVKVSLGLTLALVVLLLHVPAVDHVRLCQPRVGTRPLACGVKG